MLMFVSNYLLPELPVQKPALDLALDFVGHLAGVQMHVARDLTIGLTLTRLLQSVKNAPPEAALCSARRRG
jgi:hypothetical protein